MALVTRQGKGSTLSTANGDGNWDILNGINEAITSTPRAVTIADQNKTLELGASSSVVNLPALPVASQDSEINDFLITIKNIDTTAKTVNAYNAGDGTETFDDGTNSFTLAQGEFMTIQSDSTAAIWNVINRGNYLSSPLTWSATQTLSKGADVVADTALPVLTDGNYYDVTGTTTIATIDTLGVGTIIGLHFDDIVTLTHSADLFLPGAADITTAAGDETLWIEYATGDYRCIAYQRAASVPYNSVDAAAEIAIMKELFHFQYEESSGTGSDTYTANGWRKIDLNTEKFNSLTGATVASAVITLAAGTYDALGMFITSPTSSAGRYHTRLYQTSGTPATLAEGSNAHAHELAGFDNPSYNASHIVGRFTLAAEEDVEFQVYPKTRTLGGEGQVTSGQVETYSSLQIRRVSN